MKCLDRSRGESRPVGYVMMVGWGCRIVLYRTQPRESHRTLRDGSCLRIAQAFHAWLPSYCPSGTKRTAPRDCRQWQRYQVPYIGLLCYAPPVFVTATLQGNTARTGDA